MFTGDANTWFLGVDTSAYTTSVALVDGRGNLVADEREVLSVPPGQKGLRQSEAVFQHVKNLPALFSRLPAGWGARVRAVAASTAPRPVPESYMPVFLAGVGAARVAASACGAPFLPISHQEGHIWAGYWSAGEPVPERFYALHISGGTTELLVGAPAEAAEGEDGEEKARGRLHLRRVGGTQDLAAGQMIDRVGVALGLPFPAGAPLERLAQEEGGSLGVERPVDQSSGSPGKTRSARASFRLPVSIQGTTVSFSGPTTAALRALAAGTPGPVLARAVLECVAETLIGLIREARKAGDAQGTGAQGDAIRHLLAVGGVMANGLIRDRLAAACAQWGIRCVFAQPRYSVDNAVGVAVAAAAGAPGIKTDLLRIR